MIFKITKVAAGVAGALFIGYCFYFDNQRRGDKDFKKKLHLKRKALAGRKMEEAKQQFPDVSSAISRFHQNT